MKPTKHFCYRIKKTTMARMTKERRERLKEHAKLLYTRENVTTQKELAERVGVTEKTISSWISKGNWDKYKRNFILTREEQMANLLEELSEINASIKQKEVGERFADAKLAQVRRQLIKDIKDLETKALLPEIISALTQFLNFVRKNSLDDAQSISHYVDNFIKTKLR